MVEVRFKHWSLSLQHGKCSDRASGYNKHKAWIPSFQNLKLTDPLGRQRQYLQTVTHSHVFIQGYTFISKTHRVIIQSKYSSCEDFH